MANFAALSEMVAPMMRKLGGWVGHGLAALSPVDLARDTGWRKALGTDNPWAVFGAGLAVSRGGSTGFAAARAANPAIKSYGIGDWFRGRTYEDMIAMGQSGFKPTSAMMQAMRGRSMIRAGATAAVLGPMLFSDQSFPGQITRTARSVGINAMAATALTPISPIAGAVYAGWSGVNALRRGNNFGPF